MAHFVIVCKSLRRYLVRIACIDLIFAFVITLVHLVDGWRQGRLL